MKIKKLHRWDVPVDEAIKLQEKLSKRLKFNSKINNIRVIAACDCAYHSPIVTGCVLVFSYPELELLEEAYDEQPINFSYIPGLLAFREAPVLINCFKKIKSNPQLILFDGHGIAHPRRLGIASHLGLILDKPTIGVAKSKLIGEYKEPLNLPGSYEYLYDNSYQIGIVLRTVKGAKPIFISPGYKITLIDSMNIVINLLRSYRLPEPLRIAHFRCVNTYSLRE